MSEAATQERYGKAARKVEAALCCPVSYNPKYLEIIPDEIIEKDYGCGDPTPYLRLGDRVLDLGSGGGKICYIAAQIVGPGGSVIGVDCNQDMLALARHYQPIVAKKLNYANVDFRCGMIQDLKLNLDLLAEYLASNPIRNQQDWINVRTKEEELRKMHPLVPDKSIDCVISNCVLNLVKKEDRFQLFSEIYRVLCNGGRAVISDIVSDEVVSLERQHDPYLWSGCLSGAYQEEAFLKAFEEAGFHGIEIVKRQERPWQIIDEIEFRSITVSAYKGKQGPCLGEEVVVYTGPFKKVHDDDGHVFIRGQRTKVCEKTFNLLQRRPYSGMFIPIEAIDTECNKGTPSLSCPPGCC